MRRGAIALLDALGFKGIWKDGHPWTADDVVDKLRRAMQEAHAAAEQDKRVRRSSYPAVGFHFLSDTVVAVAEAPADDCPPSQVVNWLCASVARFTEQMLISTEPPPLAYRGAISFGDFMVDEPFILGRAVDEAAEAERLAEGAFVWLCPSALAVVNEQPGIGTLRYHVPMKGGQHFETLLVPPVWGADSGEIVFRSLRRAFRLESAPLSAHIKFQNTRRMVAHARREWKKDSADTVDRDAGRGKAGKAG